MSSVRTRAGGRQVPGKRIPPPPSFSPPSLPDTDNLLTVYSRNSRSVSPVSPVFIDLVKDTETSDKKDAHDNESKHEDIKPVREEEIEQSCEGPGLIVEPPSPAIERRVNGNQDKEGKDETAETETERKRSKESEVVQIQESQQHSQQDFDGFDRQEKKPQEIDELTEQEQTSLCHKFPLQEEKQMKHKLKRRVSKKSSKSRTQNSYELSRDEAKNKEINGKAQESKVLKENLESEINLPKSTVKDIYNKESLDNKSMKDGDDKSVNAADNKTINSGAQIKCQAVSMGLPNLDADPTFKTSDVEKVRMQEDKQHERLPETDSEISACNVKNDKSDILNATDPDDIVQEILGSCSDVKKILSRIMDDTDDTLDHEDEEQDHPVPSLDESPNKKDDNMLSQTIEETSVDLVENIADLTVDKVKEYLQMEEQANEILKRELEETRKIKETIERNKSEKSQCVLQENRQNNSTRSISFPKKDALKPNKVPEVKDKPKAKTLEREKTHYKSKKDHQIAQIKDFLKDPNSSSPEDIQLDVRLRKTDSEKEESSKEITRILDHLYIASYEAVKVNDMCKEGIGSVIEISNHPNMKSVQEVLHIKYSEENVTLEKTFEQIADKVESIRKSGGKILIACEESTGISASLCVPYLVKYERLRSREAVKMMEEKRKEAKLHPGIIIRMEEWEAKLRGWRVSQGFPALVASWLPMVFVIILGYLLFKKIFEIVETDHKLDKRTDADFYTKLYEYFDIRNWP